MQTSSQSNCITEMNFIKTSLLLLSILHAISAGVVYPRPHRVDGEHLNDMMEDLLSGNIEGVRPPQPKLADQIWSDFQKLDPQRKPEAYMDLVDEFSVGPGFGYKPGEYIPIKGAISNRLANIHNAAAGSNSVPVFNPAKFLPAGSNGNGLKMLRRRMKFRNMNQHGSK